MAGWEDKTFDEVFREMNPNPSPLPSPLPSFAIGPGEAILLAALANGEDASEIRDVYGHLIVLDDIYAMKSDGSIIPMPRGRIA